MRLTPAAAFAALLATSKALNVGRQMVSIPMMPTTPTDNDVDVTSTITVTDRSDRTVTADTTVFRTVFTTIIVTVTDISTLVTTVSDVDTATETIYVTSTQQAKRAIDVFVAAPEPTPELHVPAETGDSAGAEAAQVTGPTGGFDSEHVLELIRRRGLQKRETVFVTVTVAVDGITTLFNTITSTVLSTTTSESHSTSVITSTTYENAKATITVTSTIVIKATTIVTGPAQTVSSVPPGSNIGDGGDNPDDTDGGTNNTSDESKSSGGLSSGAKIGIGVGAGVVGVLLLGGTAAYFWKQHKLKPRVVDDGMGAGMSEVPVGPTIGGAAAAGRDTRSPDPKKSPGGGYVPPHSPTPEPQYGAAELVGEDRGHRTELSGDDALPRFPTTAEADGRPVMGYSSGPVRDVYEMPADNYR